MKMKKAETTKDSNSWYIITHGFPQKTACKEDNVPFPCASYFHFQRKQGFGRAAPTKDDPGQRRTPNKPEAVTEEAKWSTVDIREGHFPVQELLRRGSTADCLFSQRCPSGSRVQSTPTQVPQERLRSSWVPTSILLYSFCCSSLKVSFTFPRFNPPSLQKGTIRQLWKITHIASLIRLCSTNERPIKYLPNLVFVT